MYADSQTKIEQLKNKIADIENEKANQQQEIEKLNQKIKDLMNKNKIMLGNTNRLQEELTVLNNNFTTKVRQLREAENQKSILDRKIKDL